MSDEIEDQDERWERVGGDYFLEGFDSIPNKRSRRPDLHAFLMLDELFPGTTDMVCSAEHDEIFLDVSEEQVATLTDEQIIELSRCGIRYSGFGLCAFV